MQVIRASTLEQKKHYGTYRHRYSPYEPSVIVNDIGPQLMLFHNTKRYSEDYDRRLFQIVPTGKVFLQIMSDQVFVLIYVKRKSEPIRS